VVTSSDGQRLGSGSYDETVKICDATSFDCIQIMPLGRTVYSLSFDLTNNTRFQTEVGGLDLALPSSGTILSNNNASCYRSTRSEFGISGDAIWILKGAEEVRWLPPAYRSLKSAVAGSTIGIGYSSGCVLLIKLL
jgi:WD40 repeat protein